MNENIDDFRLDIKNSGAKWVVFYYNPGFGGLQYETFQNESEKDHWLVTNSNVTVTQILQVV